jgi:hypothetical protein
MFKTVYILLALVAFWGLEICECASNGQISIWGQDVQLVALSRWHAPFIRAVPPDFLGTSARRLCCLYLNRGQAEKSETKGGKTSFLIFDLGVQGIILTIHILTMPKSIFLGCIEFRKRISAQRTFPSSYPSAFNPKECGLFGCS